MARTTAKKEGSFFKRPKRAPVSIEHLSELRANISTSIPKEAAIWAAALTIFKFGCRRLGETLVKNEYSFNRKYNVTKGAWFFIKLVDPNTTSTNIPTPWTKTTKEEVSSITLISRPDLLYPIQALLNHMHANDAVPSNASLFSYEIGHGLWSRSIPKSGPELISHTFTDTTSELVARWHFSLQVFILRLSRPIMNDFSSRSSSK